MHPVALVMSRAGGRKAMLISACVLVPLWTSVLVRSYAWIVILQRTGVINELLTTLGVTDQPLRLIYTDGTVMVAMTHVMLPYMILPIYSALRSIPPEFVRAARNLGAGSWRAFRAVTLPLSLPGIYAGAIMVFIVSLGFYVTPALVGGPRNMLISTLIGQQTTELLDWPFAGALAGVLLVVTLGLVALFRRFLSFVEAR
jgi:mannopine transport system permease protein